MKPIPTNQILAAAIGDVQRWLHDTRGYHPPQHCDFRDGAGAMPDAPSINVNLRMDNTVSAEDQKLLDEVERDARRLARRLHRLDEQNP